VLSSHTTCTTHHLRCPTPCLGWDLRGGLCPTWCPVQPHYLGVQTPGWVGFPSPGRVTLVSSHSYNTHHFGCPDSLRGWVGSPHRRSHTLATLTPATSCVQTPCWVGSPTDGAMPLLGSSHPHTCHLHCPNRFLGWVPGEFLGVQPRTPEVIGVHAIELYNCIEAPTCCYICTTSP
jgi:hypothetical protein